MSLKHEPASEPIGAAGLGAVLAGAVDAPEPHVADAAPPLAHPCPTRPISDRPLSMIVHF